MGLEEEMLLSVDIIKEHGIKNFQYDVDGKIYNVNEFDHQDFTDLCDEPIEDFIRRSQPKDDNELSYLIGLYLNQKLKNRNPYDK